MNAAADKIASDASQRKAKDFRIASRDWLARIMGARNVPPRAKTVAWVLYDHFNRRYFDECGGLMAFPALTTIDRKSGLSKKTVMLALGDLIKLGHVVVQRGRGGRGLAAGNRYVAVMAASAWRSLGPVAERTKESQRNDATTGQPAVNRPSRGAGVTLSGIHGYTVAGDPGNPNLLKDLSTDPMIRSAPPTDPIAKRSGRAALFHNVSAFYGPNGRALVAKAERDGVGLAEITQAFEDCVENDEPLSEFAYRNWRPD